MLNILKLRLAQDFEFRCLSAMMKDDNILLAPKASEASMGAFYYGP